MKKDEDNFTYGLFIGAGIVLLGIFIFIIVEMYGDKGDLINTNQLGEKLCSGVGMVYDSREIKYDGSKQDLKIYCREIAKEKKIIDGVLIAK
jgi:hypothetical protein